MKPSPSLTLYLHRPCANLECLNTLHVADMVERDGVFYCPDCAAAMEGKWDLDWRPAMTLLLWLLLAALVIILVIARWG